MNIELATGTCIFPSWSMQKQEKLSLMLRNMLFIDNKHTYLLKIQPPDFTFISMFIFAVQVAALMQMLVYHKDCISSE